MRTRINFLFCGLFAGAFVVHFMQVSARERMPVRPENRAEREDPEVVRMRDYCEAPAPQYMHV